MSKKNLFILKRNIHKKGGLEKYTLRSAIAFNEKGYNVTILSTNPSSNISFPNIDLKYFKTNKWPGYRRMKDFDNFCQSFIEKNKPKIILGMDRNRHQTHIRAGNGVHICYLQSRKLTDNYFKIRSFAYNPLHRYILDLEKKAFENPRVKKIITNSQMIKDQIHRYFTTPKEKVQVIHNGVEWHEMKKSFDSSIEMRMQIAKKYLLDPSKRFLLFVGNGYRRKGLKQLLYGLSLTKEKEYYLFILGKEKNISYYKKLSQKLHLEKKVLFLGAEKEIMPFYQASDILMLPTFYDPFANVTLEALAMGLYIVTSHFNGAKEILSDKSGMIFDDLLSPDAIAATIEKAMNHPKTPISAKNIRNSVSHLDFSHQMKKLIDCICEN